MSAIPTTLKVLVAAPPGGGKTFHGLTYPKVAYFGFEPNGLDTLRSNPQLQKNLVLSEEFVPSADEDIKGLFDRLMKALQLARQYAKDGKVETLFADNYTMLAEYRWAYINQYEKQMSSKTGNVDTQAMYGALRMWLIDFTLKQIVSFPGNTVISVHELREGAEEMSEAVYKDAPIQPNILGSFRQRLPQLVSAYIALDVKQIAPNVYKYLAYCTKSRERMTKNRYGLPPVIEDISYDKIISTLNGNTVPAVPA